jgi:hypothetical protein
MWSFSRDAIAAAGIVGCVVLVTAMRGDGYVGQPASDDDLYETTGSIGSVSRTTLPLSEEQRERIHQTLMRFPDAAGTDMVAREPRNRLPNDQLLQDLPASLTEEMPLLRGHKFVKLHDRILLIEPTDRRVVAMIPRYRLVP